MRAGRGNGVSAVGRETKRSLSFARDKPRGAAGYNKVLAQRNLTVVPVGAWVEGGGDLLQHPSALASQTEELQEEKMRESEQNLQRFQDKVRYRVAHQAQPAKKMHLQKEDQMTNEDMRWVRGRLAACSMLADRQTRSDLLRGQWNVSPSKHVEDQHDEEGVNLLITSHHDCPLIQQNVNEYPGLRSGTWCHPLVSDLELIVSDKSGTGPDQTQIPWPPTCQDSQRREHQSHFLTHRRHFMSMEREQVKENRQFRKHVKKTASIKGEKEQLRQEEERKLQTMYLMKEARHQVEEQELLILERLRLEEEERAKGQRWQNKTGKEKGSVRLVENLKTQIKERVSVEKLELPLLCCCASSFWDSHPDTCANNCIFHNNPKAYIQALQSAVFHLDLH